MLPAHIKKTQYSSPHNDNSSPFFTEDFHSFVNHLAHKNSAAAVHGFVLTTSGVSSAMRVYPYVGILRKNLKLTHKTGSILSRSSKGYYLQVWCIEIFTRILMNLPAETRGTIKVPIQDLAQCLASELLGIFLKDRICAVYSAQYLSYVQRKIRHHMQSLDVEFPTIDERTIAAVGLEVLDDMVTHFTATKNRKLCLLLSFFGANFIEDKDVNSSKILKEILQYSQHVVFSADLEGISPYEAQCREQISTAIRTTFTLVSAKIEKAELLVHSTFPWYCVHKKLQQVLCAFITIPVLTNILHTVKQTDAAYKASIRFGNCLEFFSSIQEIETTLSKHVKASASLFTSLHEIQLMYVVLPHAEYVSSVRACMSGYKTAPVGSVTSETCSTLSKTGHKIRSGIQTMHKTASAGCNVVVKAMHTLRNKAKIHTLGSPTEGLNPTSSHPMPVNDTHSPHTSAYITPSNDNAHLDAKRSKVPSWRKHLLKKAKRLMTPRSSGFLHNKKLEKSTGMHRALSVDERQLHSRHGTNPPHSVKRQHLPKLAEYSTASEEPVKTQAPNQTTSIPPDEVPSVALSHQPHINEQKTKKSRTKLSLLLKKRTTKHCKSISMPDKANDSENPGNSHDPCVPVTEYGCSTNGAHKPPENKKRVNTVFHILRKTKKAKAIAM